MKHENPSFSGRGVWDNMTFSAMQRHVMIFTVVSQSDAFLSPVDRLELIQKLIDQPINHNPESIETACQGMADLNMGRNVINSQILRDTQRGY